MTAQHTSDYPTLGEVLRLPAFAGCIVCGGAAGFQKADRSARTALRMAERTGKPCVTDDPAGVIRLLEDASSAETEAYIQRQLGALLRQPELRRQELLDTLDSWLRCMLVRPYKESIKLTKEIKVS